MADTAPTTYSKTEISIIRASLEQYKTNLTLAIARQKSTLIRDVQEKELENVKTLIAKIT